MNIMRKWILPRKYDFFQLNSSFARRIASRHQPALEEYANEQGLVYRLFLQRQEETSLDQLLDWLELLTRMMLRQNNLGKYTWQRNLFYQIYLSLNQSQSFVGKRYSQICEIYKLLEEQAQSQTPSHEVLKTLLERIQSLHAPSAEAAPVQLGHLPRRSGTSSLGKRASFMAMQSLNSRLYTLLKKQTPLFSQENREVYRLLVEQAKRTEQTAREKTALLTALSELSELEVQQLWEMVERQGLFERERRLFGDRISSEQPENKLRFILNKASHSSIQRFWAALEQLNQTKRPQRVLFSSQEELTAFWKTASVEEIHSFLDQVHRQHLLSTEEESWLQHWEREYKEEYQSALTLDHRITGLTQTALETLSQSVLTMDPQQQQQTLNQALQAPDFAREYEIYLLHRFLEPASNQERQAFAEAVRPVYPLYAQVVERLSQPSQDKIQQMEDGLEEESLALFSQAASLQQLEQWQKIRFQDRPTEELSWRSFWKQGKQQQAREAFWEEWNRQPVFAASLPQELRPVLKDFIRTELLRRGLVQKDLAVMFEQLLVWEERFEETALKSALYHFSFARELSVEELQSRLSQADSRTLHGLSQYLISLVQQNLPNASAREIRLAEQLEQVYYSKTESETRQEMQQRQQEQVRQTLQEFLSQSSQESTLLLGLRQIFPSPYRNQAAYLPEYFQQLEPYDLLRWNTVVEGFSSLEAVQPLQVQFRQFLGEQGRELSQRLVESQGKVIFEYPSFYQVIQGKETGSIYSQLLFAQQDFSALCDALVKAVVFQEDSGQTVSEIPAVLEEERKAGVEETGSPTYGQPVGLEYV